jgi:transposase
MDEKYLLYATDSSLTAPEIVRMYFEKDFVEKIFRDLKTYNPYSAVRFMQNKFSPTTKKRIRS